MESATDQSSKPLNMNNVPPAVAAGLGGHHECSRNTGGTSVSYFIGFCYWTQTWIWFLVLLV